MTDKPIFPPLPDGPAILPDGRVVVTYRARPAYQETILDNGRRYCATFGGPLDPTEHRWIFSRSPGVVCVSCGAENAWHQDYPYDGPEDPDADFHLCLSCGKAFVLPRTWDFSELNLAALRTAEAGGAPTVDGLPPLPGSKLARKLCPAPISREAFQFITIEEQPS